MRSIFASRAMLLLYDALKCTILIALGVATISLFTIDKVKSISKLLAVTLPAQGDWPIQAYRDQPDDLPFAKYSPVSTPVVGCSLTSSVIPAANAGEYLQDDKHRD